MNNKKIKEWAKWGGIFLAIVLVIVVLVRLPYAKADPTTGNFPNQTTGDITFQNGKLNTDNGVSIFTAEITNTATIEKKLSTIQMIFKDKDGKVIATMNGYLGEGLPPTSTRTIQSSIDQEIIGAVTVEYKL